MIRASSSHPLAIIPLGLIGACHCTDRNPGDWKDPGSTTLLAEPETTTTGVAISETHSAPPETGATDAAGASDGIEEDDSWRFIGVFHTESWTTPFGREVPKTGSQKLVNVDIRPDGTASMTMETCSLYFGTVEIEWTWEPLPGPWIELHPGPGEDALRFMANDRVDSLLATIDDECVMLFELDGELVITEVFRLGRACWVNRCETHDTVHIDYCDGEPPPPCE